MTMTRNLGRRHSCPGCSAGSEKILPCQLALSVVLAWSMLLIEHIGEKGIFRRQHKKGKQPLTKIRSFKCVEIEGI